jgi:hypothetical protein
MKKFITIILSIILCIIQSDDMFDCKTKFKTFKGLQKCKTPQLDSCKFSQVIILNVNYLK